MARRPRAQRQVMSATQSGSKEQSSAWASNEVMDSCTNFGYPMILRRKEGGGTHIS
jgi:hypothetical protein